MNQAPAIAVVMPVWNGEAFLREAVESILGQTFRDFEFLVVDDGSTDGTLKILSDYSSDRRLRVIQLAHGGIVHALNRGIAEARSDWIARMDCDDIAVPQRLQKQWDLVSRRSGVILCHTNVSFIGDPAFIPQRRQHMPRSQAMLKVRMCLQCPINHPTVLFRKAAFLQAGGYMPEERHAEDYALWERMLPLGGFVGIDEPLLNFRVHGGSISKVAAETQGALTAIIRSRVLQRIFACDAKEAGMTLASVTRRPGTRFSLPESASLLRLLARHHLLNLETLAWLVLNSVRAMIRPNS